MSKHNVLLNQRYRLLAPLGRGGMGIVYRAYDRLTGQTVALKQVQVAPQTLTFASRPATNESQSLLLALAQEFKLLATLRHPHIISVLDYGFDANRQPYFTMELLEQPQTLLEAGRGQPLAIQIDLLMQILQALAYLHRRGILHRDLKPDNVLVSDGRVRVLDFGLSVARGEANQADLSGTLAYLSPEVLEGKAPSEAADLYSFGVMAYELLVGQHPFQSDDIGTLISRILEADPDLGPLLSLTPVEAKLTLPTLIFQLLEKEPPLRYPSAEAVITDLCAVLGQPPPPESVAIRESFLQAATFVGREREMAQLTSALEELRHGQGSAWLLGGESGVGKSRLMEELRTQALVAGAVVVRGQAVEGGGQPYQLWQEPLRRLALAATLSDLEASVLKLIVPDIATLLERDLPDAPPLTSAESLQRLVWAVTRLFQGQQEPIVCLFEDLQWAEESLPLLNTVVGLTAEYPILVVGNYRDEERPHLPHEVPGARVLHLGRLSSTSIAQLSQAMLGEPGGHREIVSLLERETEGNTFFMVEVVRALAESAGSLGGIGELALPAHIFTGGVQRLVERRLQRIPAADFHLLELAAVIGRQIDLAALRLLATTTLDVFLLRCADVAVFEVQGTEWRFAHDKLREGVLYQLSADQQLQLHRQAAACIQQAYAADLAPHAGRLAEHYRQAGDREQERVFAHQAGDYAKQTFAQAEAIRHYSRALELTTAADERFTLLLAREEIFEQRGERAAQAADLQALVQVAEDLADDQRRLEVMMRQAEQAASVAEIGALLTYAQQAFVLAQALGDRATEVKARVRWGEALYRQADYEAAKAQFTLGLEQVEAHGLSSLAVQCLMWLSAVAGAQGDQATAYRLAQQVLQSSREIGDRGGELSALHDLGVIANATGDWVAAKQALEEALHLSRRLGYLYIECFALLNLDATALEQGEYDVAYQHNRAALPLARLLQNPLVECYLLGDCGEFFRCIGDFANAQSHFEQALHLARQIEAHGGEVRVLLRLSLLALAREELAVAAEQAGRAVQLAQEKGAISDRAWAWNTLGQVRLATNELEAAAEAFATSLDLWQAERQRPVALMALAGLAQVALEQNHVVAAQAYVDELLAWQTAHPTSSFPDPAAVYLTCYQVLRPQQPVRALEVLHTGYQLLQARAARISDPHQRQSYLSTVPAHRTLIATWEARLQSA